MKNKMLTQEKVMAILRKELRYFASEYGVKRIGLFGSYAKGIQREDSDIDILVEFERPIGLKFVEFAAAKDNSGWHVIRKIEVHFYSFNLFTINFVVQMSY